MKLLRPIERAPVDRREAGRRYAVKGEHLLRQDLVTGENEPGGAGAGIAQTHEVEQRRDVRLQRALSSEGLGDVDDEIGSGAAERGYEWLDALVDLDRLDVVAQAPERVRELTEHGVDRRLGRVPGVQKGDLHPSLRFRRPSALVWRWFIITAVPNDVSSMSVAASRPATRRSSTSARAARKSRKVRRIVALSPVQYAMRLTTSRRCRRRKSAARSPCGASADDAKMVRKSPSKCRSSSIGSCSSADR